MGIISWIKDKLRSGAEPALDKQKSPLEKVVEPERQRTREEPLFNPFGRFAEVVKTQVTERAIQYENCRKKL
ncbi:MAG TPA: hypothetical protein GXX72_07315, partial [Clostridiaceae bacterium]|nr:hypothetical protein [Clostridiaceae bacterium]